MALPDLARGERLHAEVMAMFAAKGLPEHYHGWWDGGESFTMAAWCLTTHLKPRTVVETGVGRGVTSRMILEALAGNGTGRLFSVDLPAVDSNFHSQIAIAVPGHLRHGWTMIAAAPHAVACQAYSQISARSTSSCTTASTQGGTPASRSTMHGNG